MEFKDRWDIIDELGEGGQGKVYTALDTHKFDPGLFSRARESILGLVHGHSSGERKTGLNGFRKAVLDIIRMEDTTNHGALKVLHEHRGARDPERAEARIKKEIEAMSSISHPNLLEILDHDPDGKWFVSEFHPKGTLARNKDRFTGNFVGALKALRPLVEGVSGLHKNGIIHRDIKPQNVFLSSDDNLILGDFGLVFFSDAQHTRISETFQNVGSRDWMPAWAMGMKIEDIKPTFDVFSLGKLLWAMVSKKPILRLWYFDRSEFNLERMFQDAPYIKLTNPVLEKCIVENEEDCLPDASALLREIDKALSIIDRNADLIGPNVERPCRVCGIGNYKLIINQKHARTFDFGLNPAGNRSFKIFACTHCGHVQLFAFDGRQNPPAWSA